jgi:hypothetical protein
MIQLNLLPDVKQEYIKSQRLKQLMVTISLAASATALAIFIIGLSVVYIVQKKIISDLSSNITSSSAALRRTANLSDVLTVQSQLHSLATLNGQKPVTSRVFRYLSQLTPTQATISDLRIDYTLNTMTISGNAPSLDVVNTFVDGLKFTDYTTNASTASLPAFSKVVLSSFSRSAQSATYSITMTFDSAIFSIANGITLSVGTATVPTQQPSIIFKKEG